MTAFSSIKRYKDTNLEATFVFMAESGNSLTEEHEFERESTTVKSKFERRLELAGRWEVVRCALVMSAIVGTILVTINHAKCVCMGMFDTTCLIQSILTYMVPYCVSTISSVLAIEKGVK